VSQPASRWARPNVIPTGVRKHTRLARQMYRDGFNSTEIALTLQLSREATRQILRRGVGVEFVR
jgi:hypothetical protein